MAEPIEPISDSHADASPDPSGDPFVRHFAERFAQPVSGHSYGQTLRLIAFAVTALAVVFAAFAWFSSARPDTTVLLMPFAVALGMIVCCWYIVTGRTVLDRDGIRQEWVTPKNYRWDEIYRARIIKLPLNTRLMLNTGKPPFKMIHAGTDELEQAFEEVARLYATRGARRSDSP